MNFSRLTPDHERPLHFLFLKRPKNPSQAELSGEQPFLDMDLLSSPALTRRIHSGHR